MSYSLSQLDAIGDVDPVAEADVYLAYGRDLQAEEILKEAMRATPERMAIRTKLLEVYAKRRDTKGFELLAAQMHSLTRGEGEDWAKVQETGPEHRPRQPAVPAGRPSPARCWAPMASRWRRWARRRCRTRRRRRRRCSSRRPTPRMRRRHAIVDLDLDLDLDSRPPRAGRRRRGRRCRSRRAAPPRATRRWTSTCRWKRPHAARRRAGRTGADDRRAELEAWTSTSATSRRWAHAGSGRRHAGAGSDDALDFGDFGIDEPPQAPSGAGDDAEALARKLELAEEFRQIGDVEGARDLLEEVVAKADGALRSKAQGMLDTLG